MYKVSIQARLPIKSWASILEPEAAAQVINIANLPFIHRHVALMPDAHAGKGSTVGTVIATKGAIVPAAVGVDIGCGMCAVPMGIKVERFHDDARILPAIRSSIEKAIPVGFRSNATMDKGAEYLFKELNVPNDLTVSTSLWNKARLQCGSLGGGNHFIELCGDENGDAWIMLHSGSRGVGKELAEIHINRAKDLMKRYFINLPDPDLAYLVEQTQEFDDYMGALNWAQDYARANRKIMLERVWMAVCRHIPEKRGATLQGVIDCHHNYTEIENHFGRNVWVTRKGAVRARTGDMGIIPGSMGTQSFIVQGLGNPESFHSCSHGAGRRMSRTKARKTFNVADLRAQTEGVECRKDEDVLDEIPGAYKPIETVMADQADLVAIKHTLKQFLCVKG
jgi:tRNA-splicing ligase RtcB (3'-phosphate/5'-hydroxy nucleic acid ligase)